MFVFWDHLSNTREQQQLNIGIKIRTLAGETGCPPTKASIWSPNSFPTIYKNQHKLNQRLKWQN